VESLGHIGRVKGVLVFTGKKLAAIDGDLIQPNVLDNIADALNEATAETQNFLSTGSASHLGDASTHAKISRRNFTFEWPSVPSERRATQLLPTALPVQIQFWNFR
jgi:hypothetical protein